MASDNVTSLQEAAPPVSGIDGEVRRGLSDMAGLCRGTAGGAIASGQALACGSQEVTATLLAFWQSLAKDTVAATQQLAACSSPEAVVEVQFEYATAILQAWSDEFDRLHALGGRILADTLVPVRRRTLRPAAAPPRGSSDALAA